MECVFRILVINFGSTSSKIAVFENKDKIYETTCDVDKEIIYKSNNVFDQYEMRRESILDYISSLGLQLKDFDFIVSRGSGDGVQNAGAYIIDEAYVEQCRRGAKHTNHASYIGPCVAYELAEECGIKAFVYDSDCLNEFSDVAYLSGNKLWNKMSGGHMLSTKAAARKAAEVLGGKYEDFNFVVSHLGGGITTNIHEKGRLVDSTMDAYAPERSGSIPLLASTNFLKVCFSGDYSKDQISREMIGKGGLMSYLGTSDLIEVEKRIQNGDMEAELYYRGMVYYLAMDIAAMASVVNFNVDRIVLTGSAAHSEKLVKMLTDKVEPIAPVIVFPGTLEMESLANGALRAFLGEEICWRYTDEESVLYQI